MTDSGDAIALSEMWNRAGLNPVRYLGFIFYDLSPRNALSVEMATISALGEIFDTVGVFVDTDIKGILDVTLPRGIKTVQLHGHETPAECAMLKEKGFKVIKAFGIGGHYAGEITEMMRPYNGIVDYFLLDTAGEKAGGNGKKFDWNVLEDVTFCRPFILSGGIKLDDVEAVKSAFATLPMLAGIDINSGFEITPGRKDTTKIKEFVNKVFSESE